MYIVRIRSFCGNAGPSNERGKAGEIRCRAALDERSEASTYYFLAGQQTLSTYSYCPFSVFRERGGLFASFSLENDENIINDMNEPEHCTL